MKLTCRHNYLEPIDSDSSDSESDNSQNGVEDQMSEGSNFNEELETEAAPGAGDDDLDEESRYDRWNIAFQFHFQHQLTLVIELTFFQRRRRT